MTRSRGSWLIDAVLVGAWLTTIGAVAVYETGWFGRTVNISRRVQAQLAVREQWFGIYYQNRKVGFANTTLTPAEHHGHPGFVVSDQGWLRVALLGAPQQLTLRSQAFVDANYRVHALTARVSAEDYTMQIRGERRGDAIRVEVASQDSVATHTIPDPAGELWVGGLSPWSAFQRWQVGQSGSVWVLNPLALRPERIFFHIVRREAINGEEALVIESDMQGIATTTWVTSEGRVLKETSMLGWELREEPMAEAVRSGGADAPAADLLDSAAVSVDRALDPVEQIGRLLVRVDGLAPAAIAVAREPWQVVRASSDDPAAPWCELALRRPAPPSDEPRGDAAPPKRYVHASLFVQAEDPLIRAKALEVTAGLDDPWAQAQALARWVHRSVAKRLTIGLPSARDVLLQKSGDCHEHTVLFTALARSRQIPTRMVAGLVYQQGRFYYHAWPEVWMRGAWRPLDPTLGQDLADATHLGLLEAEAEDLIGLAPLVGRLAVRVLEVE